MQDIEFNCPYCAHRFSVLGVLAGADAICPGCAKTCKVPLASQTAPVRSAPKPTAAPVVPTSPARSPAKPILAGVLAVALIALAGYWYKGRLTAEPHATPPPQVAAAVPQPPPRPAPEPVAPPAPTPAAMSEQPETEEQALLRRIASQMLAKYPLSKAGDTVTLTLRNGISYEGVLVSVDDRNVNLEREDGPVQIALSTLDVRTRARVDNEFRIDLIKKLVRAHMARHAAGS